jgi:hypothetical protein
MQDIIEKIRWGRTKEFIVLGEEMPPSGPAAALSTIGTNEQTTRGVVHVVFPSISMKSYDAIGFVAARWPLLELYINEMTVLLTNVTGGDPNMRGIYNWKRRIAYHEEQFRQAFEGYQKIVAIHQEIMKLVRRTKRVRDFVCHGQVVGQPTKKGFSLRFIDHSVEGDSEKRYLVADLYEIAAEMSHAAGFLEAIAKVDPDMFSFSSQELSALQSVFGAGRWNLAIDRALKIKRPEPSADRRDGHR